MPADLKQKISDNSFHFDFFQITDLINQLLDLDENKNAFFNPREINNKIKFVTRNSMGFPAGDVVRIENKESKIHLYLSFMGLYGASSPLPSYFSEPITLKKEEYNSLKEFLDIFSHRIYELFYLAWKKYSPALKRLSNYELRDANYFKKLSGITSFTTENRKENLFETSKVRFGNLLTTRVASAQNLKKYLKGLFGFKNIRVVEFSEKWFANPAESTLGGDRKLGQSSILGEKVLNRSGYFKVSIGPLTDDEFQRFKGGEAADSKEYIQQIRSSIDEFIDCPLEYDIEIAVNHESQPEYPGMLGRRRLGWETWIGKKAEETIYFKI